MDHETLRHLADTWGLLSLVIMFLLIVLFTFRPGSRKWHDDAAKIPLKED